MKRHLTLWARSCGVAGWTGTVLVLTLGGGCRGVAATATNAPPAAEATTPAARTNRADFSAFRMVTERNIFNSKRSGRVRERTREPSRVARTESIRLVGTLQADGGALAFFDGSSGEYRKALRCGGNVAGHTVVAVDPSRVTLEKEGHRVELVVGMQLRREDDSPWQVAGASVTPSPGASESAAATSGSGGGSADGETSGGDVSDVLKRLMQQREKEMQ